MSTERPEKLPVWPGKPLAVLGEAFGNRGFLACLVLLVTFAVGFQVLASKMQIQFRKAALPLRKPLEKLDQAKLFPYKVVLPQTLGPEMIDSLGTDQYIQWELKDTAAGERGKGDAPISLFVTYYTGKPDQVPHVPEVCYFGGGYKLVDQRLTEVEMPELGKGQVVPIQAVEFQREGGLLGRNKRLVLYTFHANGRFCQGRRDVQTVTANPLTKYAYFSKVEVGLDMGGAFSSREDAIEAATRLLRVVLPVLVKDHWPDWEAAVRGSASPGNAGGTTGTGDAGPIGAG